MGDLKKSITKARASGKNVRAMAVINPGNPTGGVLTKDDMKSVVEFCLANNLVLLADEVYQVPCPCAAASVCLLVVLLLGGGWGTGWSRGGRRGRVVVGGGRGVRGIMHHGKCAMPASPPPPMCGPIK